MQDGLIEVLIDAIGVLLYTVAGTVLGAVGALFEYRGYLLINSGETAVAGWIGLLGLLLLGLSYLIFSDKATVAFREFQKQA